MFFIYSVQLFVVVYRVGLFCIEAVFLYRIPLFVCVVHGLAIYITGLVLFQLKKAACTRTQRMTGPHWAVGDVLYNYGGRRRGNRAKDNRKGRDIGVIPNVELSGTNSAL